MYLPTLKLCNPYHWLDHRMSVLWSIHHSASVQVTTSTPTLLHFSSIPGYVAWERPTLWLAIKNKAKLGQDRRPPPFTSLYPKYNCHKVSSTQIREFHSYLSCLLCQGEAEVDAHLRHCHLCRANIAIAGGQRSCFVSPFALLQTHPTQWDRQEAVEDSGPVFEIS